MAAAGLENAPPVKTFADLCLEKASQLTPDILVQFCAILASLWPSIAVADKHSTASQRQHVMYQSFHSLRICNIFQAVVINFLKKLTGTEDIPNLYPQIMLRVLFERLVVLHEQIHQAVTEPSSSTPGLSALEENALRYTAGYIVRKMPSKITKRDGVENMNEALKKMTEGSDKDTALSYTREWVTTQSRGGLTLVNDGTFLFFVQLEKIVRTYLPTTSDAIINIDIRKNIMAAAMVDPKLLRLWDQITGRGLILSAVETTSLLQLTVAFYVQVRGFSYARNILERYKIKSKKSQKGQKGLRSDMKRSADPGTSVTS